MVRKYSYNPLRWYTKFIDHDHQNWGFFSFVPGNVVRLSFATLNKDTLAFEEIEEYRLTAPPFIGRQNVFNFARSIAEEDEDYRKIRTRFIQWYCKENNISDTTVYLRKKFARLPPESQMEYFDWDSYTMQWNYVQVGEAHCPLL